MATPSHSSPEKGNETFTFLCTNCKEPLKIHSSIEALTPEGLMAVLAGSPSTDSATPGDDSTSIVPVKPVFVREDGKMTDSDTNGNNGFLIIGDNSSKPQQVPIVQTTPNKPRENQDLNYRMQVTARLLDILSNQSEIKHPLCEECADFVIDQMDQRLGAIEEECNIYKEFEEALKTKGDDYNVQKEMEELEEQLKQLEVEEKELLEETDEIDRQEKQVETELGKQKEQLKEIDEEEGRYWNEYNNLKRQFFAAEDELQSVSNQLRYTSGQLDRLKRTNVFNCTFHIWHSGHFGTINGFRLGRLPTVPVEWSEINAAWGQCALLLSCLAKKVNLTFERYRLVPYGNYSFLECLDDKSKQLPLYASGGFRFMWNSKFDSAMVAFLDCLQQFKEEVEKGDSNFRLPYRMEKGKIEDPKTGTAYSIKIQFNSEEQWTKGLKYMLTNLKWVLAWVASNQLSSTTQ